MYIFKYVLGPLYHIPYDGRYTQPNSYHILLGLGHGPVCTGNTTVLAVLLYWLSGVPEGEGTSTFCVRPTMTPHKTGETHQNSRRRAKRARRTAREGREEHSEGHREHDG